MGFGRFNEFVDRKQRQAIKHLGILKKLFEKGGFGVVDNTENPDDPHIFIRNTERNLSFEGVRVYEICGDVAYRVQKEVKTHPYGKAYLLAIEDMYEDLLGEKGEDEDSSKDIAEEILKNVVKEVKNFFEKSYKAEKDGPGWDEDPLGRTHIGTPGNAGDFSNTVSDGQKG